MEKVLRRVMCKKSELSKTCSTPRPRTKKTGANAYGAVLEDARVPPLEVGGRRFVLCVES